MHTLLLALVAAYSKGEVTVTRGAKAIQLALTEGRWEDVNGTKSLTLSFRKDAAHRVEVTLVAVPGPGTYKKRNIAALAVIHDGDSIFRRGQTDCTFTLSKLDDKTVEGTASCTGDWDDGKGGKGVPVTEVKVSAAG